MKGLIGLVIVIVVLACIFGHKETPQETAEQKAIRVQLAVDAYQQHQSENAWQQAQDLKRVQDANK